MILVLNLPNNVKELCHFLGMVQYYQDIWVKRSEMLALLSDLVGKCGKTKTIKKKTTKKKPWQCGIRFINKRLTTLRLPL